MRIVAVFEMFICNNVTSIGKIKMFIACRPRKSHLPRQSSRRVIRSCHLSIVLMLLLSPFARTSIRAQTHTGEGRTNHKNIQVDWNTSRAFMYFKMKVTQFFPGSRVTCMHVVKQDRGDARDDKHSVPVSVVAISWSRIIKSACAKDSQNPSKIALQKNIWL